MSLRRLLGVSLLAAVLIAAIGTEASASSRPGAAERRASKADVLIVLKSKSYGSILETGAGRTVYGLTADKPGKSTCKGSCTSYWPPLSAKKPWSEGSGVKSSCMKLFTRTKGATQLEYCGIPLYTYILDKKAGDVKGFGVSEFGGTWYPVSPSGHLVKTKKGKSTTTTTTTSPSGYGY